MVKIEQYILSVKNNMPCALVVRKRQRDTFLYAITSVVQTLKENFQSSRFGCIYTGRFYDADKQFELNACRCIDRLRLGQTEPTFAFFDLPNSEVTFSFLPQGFLNWISKVETAKLIPVIACSAECCLTQLLDAYHIPYMEVMSLA